MMLSTLVSSRDHNLKQSREGQLLGSLLQSIKGKHCLLLFPCGKTEESLVRIVGFILIN